VRRFPRDLRAVRAAASLLQRFELDFDLVNGIDELKVFRYLYLYLYLSIYIRTYIYIYIYIYIHTHIYIYIYI